MFQQRQRGDGGEFLGHHGRDQAQEDAGGGEAERLAGAVLGLDSVPGQGGGGAAGQVAVGRDQRGGAIGLQRLTQQQRDGTGLGLGIRRDLGGQAGQRRLPCIGAARLPGGDGVGGTQRLTQQAGAGVRGGGGGPGGERPKPGAHHREQFALAEPGMGGRTVQRIGFQRGRRGLLRVQHDVTVRQACDHLQQRRRGRNGATQADAGGDHQASRRRRLPRLRLGDQRQHSPHADIEQRILRQPSLPGLHHAAQENGGDLPVPRQFALDQAFEARQPGGGQLVGAAQQVQVALLERDLVEQRSQFACQAPGLFDGDAAATGREALHKAGQHALPAQRRHCGGQFEQRRQGQLIGVLG